MFARKDRERERKGVVYTSSANEEEEDRSSSKRRTVEEVTNVFNKTFGIETSIRFEKYNENKILKEWKN